MNDFSGWNYVLFCGSNF